MRYYLYAIHTDQTDNRHMPAKPFNTYAEAEAEAKEMRRGRAVSDNYFIRIVPAESDEEAVLNADAMRPFPKLKMS